MKKIKLEHIDNLRRWKRSGSQIGSRWVPHHLYQYEEVKYQQALKYKYLETTQKDRVNLLNLWQKVCLAKWWKNYTLIKNTETAHASILLDEREIQSWPMKEIKSLMKSYV